jgi:predicted TIM-barrel fold metal-dependent hydrolase
MQIDFHVHLYDELGYGDVLAETAKNLGFDRLCIAGGEPGYNLAANAEVRRLADQYPDLFIPFAHVILGQDGPHAVERLARVGFRGLCVWTPPAPYDDESFFPVYEAAEALALPILFHTCYPPLTPLDRARRVRAENMRPVYLDTLARCFPGLKIGGVGLGSPWCQEAAETLRHHSNVFFDLSGDAVRYMGVNFLGSLLRPELAAPWEDMGSDLWGQIVFGSGVRHEEIESAERDYHRNFRSLALSPEDTEAVMGRTAARLLNLSEDS